jgi:MFS transporter, DHA1 family, inner membrane transport protein
MTDAARTAIIPDSPARSPALLALCLGNFMIGTGIMLPAGLLNELAQDLSISAAQAGQLIAVGALAIGLGSPVMSALTSKIDRRVLLTGSLASYAALYAASALAPGFDMLLALRILALLAAAVFTPQAAAAAGRLAGPAGASAAVVFVFLGWSISSVAGMPLGSLFGALAGWRAAFAGMGLCAALAAGAVWFALPRGMAGLQLSWAAWRSVFGSPALMLVLSVTALSAAGQFALFTYLAPVFKAELTASPTLISGLFALFGGFGVVGTAWAARRIGPLGAQRTVGILLICMLAALLLWPATRGNLWLTLIPVALWGFACFATNSSQQARLLGLAPPLASATIALNSSCIYLGQAIGAFAGGWLIAGQNMTWLPLVGAAFMAIAMAASTAAPQSAPPA